MPGDIKYKDINNDGIINDEDIVPIGFAKSPEIVYGFECRWDTRILIFLVSFKEQPDLLSLLIPKQRILSCKWISEETTSMV